jgi:hypothetical protein
MSCKPNGPRVSQAMKLNTPVRAVERYACIEL